MSQTRPRNVKSTVRSDADDCTYILITGANTGLGLGTCKRLIDDFLSSRPAGRERLHLIISTRSAAKASATLSALRAYTEREHEHAVAYYSQGPDGDGGDGGGSSSSSSRPRSRPRIEYSTHQLDLCSLRSVLDAAIRITTYGDGSSPYPRIDAFICNAGLTGWNGLDWWKAFRAVMTDVIDATTNPQFNLSDLGLVTSSQLLSSSAKTAPSLSAGGREGRRGGRQNNENEEEEKEPPLAQVFCGNVFGHYLLASKLAPLLTRRKSKDPQKGQSESRGPARVIWLSTISGDFTSYSPEDMQCLTSRAAYSSSKRLTDLLVLTSTLPASAPYVRSMFAINAPSGRPSGHTDERNDNDDVDIILPEMYLCHPGVVSTEIQPLNSVMRFLKNLTLYTVRLLGSPWHVISPIKGACAPAWLALAPTETLHAVEGYSGEDSVGSRSGPSSSHSFSFSSSSSPTSSSTLHLEPKPAPDGFPAGKAKWGSSTDRWGRERVRRTYTRGWGYCGGDEPAENMWQGLLGENRMRRRRRGWWFSSSSSSASASNAAPVGKKRKKSDDDDGDDDAMMMMTATNRKMKRDAERREFEELGVDAWKQMETLRREWEARLEKDASGRRDI